MDTLPTIPVICTACRKAVGKDDPAHAQLAELLSFDPVPVRAHSNNWTPAHQRGFIAALAITGSLNKAARAVGRYPFGAERLRKARGGTSFAMAWDAALELCRTREAAMMGADLKQLEEQARADSLRARSVFVRGRADRGSLRARENDDDETVQAEEVAEAMERIASRLKRARGMFLLTIVDDPEKRAAWELLVGPVDWDQVGEVERPHPSDHGAFPKMTHASMVVPVQAGMLPDLSGDEPHPVLKFLAALGKAADDLTEEEGAAIAAHVEMLQAGGWTQQDDGSWSSPEAEGDADGEAADPPTQASAPAPNFTVRIIG